MANILDLLTGGLPGPSSLNPGGAPAPSPSPIAPAASPAQIQVEDPTDDENRLSVQAQKQYNDLLQSLKNQYFGVKPGQDGPTKGQRIKKGAAEVLRALLQPDYTPAPVRLKERADKEYQLLTQRMGATMPLERMAQQLGIAEQKAQAAQQKMAEDALHHRNNEGNAVQRNLGTYLVGLMRGDAQQQRAADYGRLVNSQIPLNGARAGLINQQTQNQRLNGGLGGMFGETNRLLSLPDQQGPAVDLLQRLRNATKFQPQAGGAGADKPRIFSMPEEIFNPDTGETQKQMVLNAVRPSELSSGSKVISGSPNAISSKEAERVRDFGQASIMARDLAQTYGRALASGQAQNFMGLLEGNPLSQELRAKGLFDKKKTPGEALAQVLSANGLFQHVSSFAGRRITNRELDYMKRVLGKQSDTPESAIAAAVAASQLLEAAQLRNGRVLDPRIDPGAIMEAEANRFINSAKAGKPTELRSMRDLLAQNGLLKGAQKPDNSGNPGMGDKLKALQDEIRRRKQSGR